MIRNATATAAASVHAKCRGGIYPRSAVSRATVPDEVVPWSTAFVDYEPPEYTSPSVDGKPWADPSIAGVVLSVQYEDFNRGAPKFKPKWNSLDGNVNRMSHNGEYKVYGGRPLNPRGRTGLCGRGLLGRWGPNHAADPVVTRWKLLAGDKVTHSDTKRPILQLVTVKRRDNGEWALPGGMVDPGERIAAAAVREFREEATNSLQMTDDEKCEWNRRFEKFFSRGESVYSGYVDDPRNTDNAWIETSAYSFHDESGAVLGGLALSAGDDAAAVRWVDVSGAIGLYATHRDIVRAVAELRNAHW